MSHQGDERIGSLRTLPVVSVKTRAPQVILEENWLFLRSDIIPHSIARSQNNLPCGHCLSLVGLELCGLPSIALVGLLLPFGGPVWGTLHSAEKAALILAEFSPS